MKKHSFSSKMFLSILVFLSISFTGCDKINSLLHKKSTVPADTDAEEIKASSDKEKSVQMTPDTLARVGNWTITIDAFQDRLDALKEVVPEFDPTNEEAKNLVLDELIRQQLIVEDAERKGKDKNKDIVAAVEEFRRSLIVRDAVNDLTKDVKVTDADAFDFYEENKEALIRPLELHIREIVVDTQLKANELLTQILKGANFEELAKQNSISASASNGGDLGFLTDAPFEEMAVAALDLSEGEVSSVFKGPEGYYIIKLEEKKGGESIPFEELKEDIIQNQTVAKQQKILLDYIEKLKQDIPVEENKDLLNR